MGRFGKETVDVVAKRQFQAKGDAARAAANAARQINKQWVTGVNDASLLREIALSGAGPLPHSPENSVREFSSSIKETVWIGLRCFTALLNRHAVIIFVFYDRHAVATQLRFFPGAGVGRHMYRHF